METNIDEFINSVFTEHWREKAASRLGTCLRRVRVLSIEKWVDLIHDALDKNKIDEDQRNDLLESDIVVRCRRGGQPMWAVGEISVTVDRNDVERAARRARFFRNVVSEKFWRSPPEKRYSRTRWNSRNRSGCWYSKPISY